MCYDSHGPGPTSAGVRSSSCRIVGARAHAHPSFTVIDELLQPASEQMK